MSKQEPCNSTFGNRIANYFRARFSAWVDRRLKPARRHTLNRQSLFIVPSMPGFGYILVNSLLWLTGTNYENNLILGLAFLQVSLFVVCIHHTFFNLTGLSLEAMRTAPCYVGELAELELQISRPGRAAKENIQLGCAKQSLLTVDLIEPSCVTVKLFVPALERGWFQPGRILVQSDFPLGLIRCWSWLAFDLPVLVYPKPIASDKMPISSLSGVHGEVLDAVGSEDFYGLKKHVSGMPIRHIAWKHYARGQGLFNKEYVAYQAQSLWLAWEALEGLGVEARLSNLCYWVKKIGAADQPFGLRLPGVVIQPGSGIAHQQQALKALALFQMHSSEGSIMQASA